MWPYGNSLMAHVVVDVCSWDLSSLGPVMIGEYLCGLGRKGLHLKLGYSGYVISAFAHNNCTGGLGQKRDIQQGMNHPPTSIHGANMNDASVYNIFGHDPEGRIACLAAYFYGPAWRPTIVFESPVRSSFWTLIRCNRNRNRFGLHPQFCSTGPNRTQPVPIGPVVVPQPI